MPAMQTHCSFTFYKYIVLNQIKTPTDFCKKKKTNLKEKTKTKTNNLLFSEKKP